MAALTEEERASVRHHLGYFGIDEGAALVTGIPYDVKIALKINRNMDSLSAPALGRVRQLLCRLEDTEEQLFQSQKRMKVRAADEVELNPNREFTLLENAFMRWAKRLADLLAVPLHPSYLRSMGSPRSGSIPRSVS